MWSCNNCHEQIEDSARVCWNCASFREGFEGSSFDKVDDDASSAPRVALATARGQVPRVPLALVLSILAAALSAYLITKQFFLKAEAQERDWPRGWYCAGSKLIDDDALGGFGPCNNFPKECAEDFPGTKGQLSLVAYPEEIVDFRERKAMLVRLVNRTVEVVGFRACDSRLYIVQEAIDKAGQWKALEGVPHTFCGNSFHRVFLEPDQYWDFFALPPDGSFKTRLRFRLDLGEKRGIFERRGVLYSNEYEGSIDLAAFVQDTGRRGAGRR
jgi:hypothetical protein